MSDTLFSQALNVDDNGFIGLTVVQWFAVAALTIPPNTILRSRVRFEASSVTEGFNIANAYIGHAAGSGDAYDFLETPVQLLFSGAANVNIGIGATATSDWANFAYNKTSPLIVSYAITSTTDSPRDRSGLGSNIVRYVKAANEAALVNKTGYTTASGQLTSVNLIEVETESGGFFF